MTKSKVRGMMLGVAIGDALGMPVETFTYEKIKETYGLVKEYLVPDGHKWYDGRPKGTWTDDTQLTLAVAEGLIEAKGFDLDIQIKHHIDSYKNYGTVGWGYSTKSAVRNLANNVPWNEAAATPVDGKGEGNGVAMKVAPLALLAPDPFQSDSQFYKDIANLCKMTHDSSLVYSSSLAHIFGLKYCLNGDRFNSNVVQHICEFITDNIVNVEVNTSLDNFFKLNNQLQNDEFLCRINDAMQIPMFIEEAIERFGGGTCYCLNSIPFSYYFFAKNPHDIRSMYEAASGGGDTDSNASMVGALLGALNGEEIFPKNLVDELDQKDMILETADRLYATFCGE